MNKWLMLVSLLLMAGAHAQDAPSESADASPMDLALPEDKETLIHCVMPEDTKVPPPYAATYVAKAGHYSYLLYVPPGYSTHPDEHYPALFIADPSGNANMSVFRDRARREGWIVIMFIESKNGDWGPIYGNQVSAYQDVVQRVRILDQLKFATGFSGGARCTSVLTQIFPGFRGELLQGAGFAFDDGGAYQVAGIHRNPPYAVFMGVGDKDSNVSEVDRMKSAVGGGPFKSETFSGGHQPNPPAVFNHGIDWLLQKTLAKCNPDWLNDFHPFVLRHFDYMASQVDPKDADQLQYLIDLGSEFSLDQDPARSPKLTELQTALDQVKK